MLHTVHLMTGSLHNPWYLLRGLKAKHGDLLLCLAVLVSFSLPAAAQEQPYTADSLISTFRNGTQSPLKGSEIRLSDLVVEVKKSSVTFKSSRKDKVTCELVSPLQNLSQGPSIGSPLTVMGKVRGRGMMGNVTLDQCTLAPLSPVVSKEETATDLPQQASVEPATQAQGPVQSPLEPAEVGLQTPVSTTVPMTSKPAVVVQAPVTLTAASALDKPGPSEQTPQKIEQPQTSNTCSDSFVSVGPYGSHILVALVTGFGTLALTKFRPSRTRLRTSLGASPQDVRRAALEALLSKQKK